MTLSADISFRNRVLKVSLHPGHQPSKISEESANLPLCNGLPSSHRTAIPTDTLDFLTPVANVEAGDPAVGIHKVPAVGVRFA